MPTLTPYTVSSAIDAFLKSADAAAARLSLGLSAYGGSLAAALDAAAARSVLGLGSAAVFSAVSFEAAGAVSAHASVTSGVHGISSFGATLVDDADAAAARATLGLGTASTSTLGSLLSDLTYTASSRILSSTSTGASATLTLADGTNPGLMASADYTKLNAIPTQRAVARNTGSTGAAEQVTISQMLDWISGTPASGDLIYRSSGSYARLAKGTTNGGLLYIDTVTPIPTWSTKWTLDSTGTLTGATGSLSGSSTPAIAITQTWNNVATTFKALTVNVTNTFSAQGSKLAEINFGAAEYFSIRNETGLSGAADQPGIYLGLLNIRSFYGTVQINNGPLSANGVCIGPDSAKYLSIQANYLQYVNTLGQSFLAIDGNDKWAFRNSTTAQSVAIYNTYTSTSNFERLRVYGGGAGQDFVIAAERDATPTGGYRGISVVVGGSERFLIDSSGKVYIKGSTAEFWSGFAISGSITFSDGYNIVAGTTTGTKIGAGTTQKLGFWNATPVIQPASANQAAVTATAGATYTATEQGMLASLKTLVNQLRSDLVTIGIIKGSA